MSESFRAEDLFEPKAERLHHYDLHLGLWVDELKLFLPVAWAYSGAPAMNKSFVQ